MLRRRELRVQRGRGLLSERNLRSNPERRPAYVGPTVAVKVPRVDSVQKPLRRRRVAATASAVGHLRNASRHLNLQAPLGVLDPASTDFQASPSEGRTLISIGPPALWCAAASHRRGSALLHTPSSAFLHHLYLNAARLALSLAFSLSPFSFSLDRLQSSPSRLLARTMDFS
ncbi:hypothetical protein CMUS01_04683 [Colletotrichum musicola]|uniref:Uncharacterized protein n=1 Tax=Colletotrichum musicola TaxID=2175873 RepID=A0A8H6KVF6_9PEZI|nr:hypothetical protein CMUS01_04683 [Colletotrichum musicola]